MTLDDGVVVGSDGCIDAAELEHRLDVFRRWYSATSFSL
jgi:hypothetical protein